MCEFINLVFSTAKKSVYSCELYRILLNSFKRVRGYNVQ